MSSANQAETSGFRVVGGNPTPEELAIVVAVLQAAASASKASKGAKTAVSSWSSNAGLLRESLTPGHGQWQAAFRRGLNR